MLEKLVNNALHSVMANGNCPMTLLTRTELTLSEIQTSMDYPLNNQKVTAANHSEVMMLCKNCKTFK